MRYAYVKKKRKEKFLCWEIIHFLQLKCYVLFSKVQNVDHFLKKFYLKEELDFFTNNYLLGF